MTFATRDRVASGDRKATLKQKQPAVLEYIETNVDHEGMANTIMLFALAMDSLC
jgi:hypothetical protein